MNVELLPTISAWVSAPREICSTAWATSSVDALISRADEESVREDSVTFSDVCRICMTNERRFSTM